MKIIHRKPSHVITSNDWLGINFGPSKQVMRLIEETYPLINVLSHDGFSTYSVGTEGIFMMPDEDDLLRIEQENPWVMDVCGHEHLAQFQASYSFMSLCRKRKTFNVDRTTYGLKHDVESICRTYISEGSFIRGALLAGFTLKPSCNSNGCGLNLITDTMYYYLLRVLKRERDKVELLDPVCDSSNDENEIVCV